jgi:hypothetical protein
MRRTGLRFFETADRRVIYRSCHERSRADRATYFSATKPLTLGLPMPEQKSHPRTAKYPS